MTARVLMDSRLTGPTDSDWIAHCPEHPTFYVTTDTEQIAVAAARDHDRREHPAPADPARAAVLAVLTDMAQDDLPNLDRYADRILALTRPDLTDEEIRAASINRIGDIVRADTVSGNIAK